MVTTMSNDLTEMIILSLAVYAIVGILEFAISTWFLLNQTYSLASEGQIVEFSRVFSAWFSNILYHLVTDALISAIVYPFVALLLK